MTGGSGLRSKSKSGTHHRSGGAVVVEVVVVGRG